MNLMDIVKKGVTDRSVTLKIIDSGDGTPETGVVFNTSGIDLWYRRESSAKVSITEATLAALTTAHTDGGFLHISDGEYRLDLPDAAFATGANHVDIGGTVTGMIVIGGRVRLTDFDLESADVGIRSGLKRSQAIANFPFQMINATTELPEAGATVTVTRKIDGGSFGAGTLGSVTDAGSGDYTIPINTGDMNGTTITLKFAATGCKTREITLITDPA